jgi:hypothetical protein
MKRTCNCCNKTQPLNKKHFQVVKSFKQGFSFWCLDCDEKSKKPKPRDKKEEKFLHEKLEVKLQHKDISEIVSILGYYKGELQSYGDYDIPTHGLDKLIGKLNKQLEEHK